MPASDTSTTNSELAALCRQFSSLVHAEINILEVLEALRAQTSNPQLRETLDSVREDLEMGRTLATAFSRYPQTFSPFFISMIRQGELEGELDTVLAELATHFESRLDDAPDATRRRGGGAFDVESLATLMTWMLAWVAALLSASALLIGALIYAHHMGAAPGDIVANVCILVGVIMFLGVVLLARGKRR